MLLEAGESLCFLFLYSQLDFTVLERSDDTLDFLGLLYNAVSVLSGHSVLQVDVQLGNNFEGLLFYMFYIYYVF